MEGLAGSRAAHQLPAVADVGLAGLPQGVAIHDRGSETRYGCGGHQRRCIHAAEGFVQGQRDDRVDRLDRCQNPSTGVLQG